MKLLAINIAVDFNKLERIATIDAGKEPDTIHGGIAGAIASVCVLGTSLKIPIQ